MYFTRAYFKISYFNIQYFGSRSREASCVADAIGYRAGAAHVLQPEYGCDFGGMRVAGDALT